MAEIKRNCTNCSAEIISDIGQNVTPNGSLRWYEAYHCPNCNADLEFDDIGIPPDYIRNLILESEGEWTLVVKSLDKSKKFDFTKVLRNLFNYSLQDAIKILSKIPGIIYQGTQAEVQWIQKHLDDYDIDSEIMRSDK